MRVKIIRLSEKSFKFETDPLDPPDARRLDVVLSEAGIIIERVKDLASVGKGKAPDKEVLDSFYGDE